MRKQETIDFYELHLLRCDLKAFLRVKLLKTLDSHHVERNVSPLNCSDEIIPLIKSTINQLNKLTSSIILHGNFLAIFLHILLMIGKGIGYQRKSHGNSNRFTEMQPLHLIPVTESYIYIYDNRYRVDNNKYSRDQLFHK